MAIFIISATAAHDPVYEHGGVLRVTNVLIEAPDAEAALELLQRACTCQISWVGRIRPQHASDQGVPLEQAVVLIEAPFMSQIHDN